MNEYLPDALSIIGLAALATGVAWQFGWPWALMVVGLALLLTGVGAALRKGG